MSSLSRWQKSSAIEWGLRPQSPNQRRRTHHFAVAKRKSPRLKALYHFDTLLLARPRALGDIMERPAVSRSALSKPLVHVQHAPVRYWGIHLERVISPASITHVAAIIELRHPILSPRTRPAALEQIFPSPHIQPLVILVRR